LVWGLYLFIFFFYKQLQKGSPKVTPLEHCQKKKYGTTVFFNTGKQENWDQIPGSNEAYVI